jgi:hypothetical protein
MRSSFFFDVTQGLSLVTDVSVPPVGTTFNGHVIHEEFDCLTLKDETDKLSRNVGN